MLVVRLFTRGRLSVLPSAHYHAPHNNNAGDFKAVDAFRSAELWSVGFPISVAFAPHVVLRLGTAIHRYKPTIHKQGNDNEQGRRSKPHNRQGEMVFTAEQTDAFFAGLQDFKKRGSAEHIWWSSYPSTPSPCHLGYMPQESSYADLNNTLFTNAYNYVSSGGRT